MKLSKLWRQTPRSFKNRVRNDDLAPDGVLIKVDWDKFPVGGSAFVPCVNTLECVRQLNDITTRRGWMVEYRPRPESGVWGVRFWRLL